MTLREIHLQQFRSYTDKRFIFDPGVTVITGPNGSGKTNSLEAIYLMGYGKSFRDNDETLMGYGKNWWRVAATVDDTSRELRYETSASISTKTFIFENEKRGRFTSRYQLPIILFEPDDLLLVHGSPSRRRSYLDALLGRLSPSYATILRRYERALAQRNKLLKQSVSIDEDTMFIWDIALAEEATLIVAMRKDFIERANRVLSNYYSHIAEKEHQLEIRYVSHVHSENYKQSLIHALKSRYDRDQATGFTSAGPHRDDIDFMMDNKDMELTASRGEIRTLLLSLKRIETDRYRDIFETTPLFLLDDVFSELDATRRKHLIDNFYDHQMIITTTNADIVKTKARQIKL